MSSSVIGWRFPRPRGDEPPNCASGNAIAWFSRPRGDEPVLAKAAAYDNRFSPPTRG